MQLRLRRRQLFNCNHRAKEIERETCLATHIDGWAHRLPTIHTIRRIRTAIPIPIAFFFFLSLAISNVAISMPHSATARPLQTSSQCAHTLELLALDMQIHRSQFLAPSPYPSLRLPSPSPAALWHIS